jgi:predicted deacetylase
MRASSVNLRGHRCAECSLVRALCIALHDVAPLTWPLCERLLALLAEMGAPRVTLLVTPDFHGQGRIDRARDFIRAIEDRLALGDELALHGYDHRDHAPPPSDLYDWVRRRVLTAGEGEFAALSRVEAEERLDRGREVMARLRWPVYGFVPPAWLASQGTCEALQESGLRYFSTHAALVELPTLERIFAPCLTASPRSPWRRVASRLWLSAAASVTTNACLVRVGLHPADACHGQLMTTWQNVLRHLLAQREALTKSQAVDWFAHAGPAPKNTAVTISDK